eukprot:COSAG06_NODE_5862_length_3240_cov_1.539000_3_plen_115_part_00
MLAIVKLVKLVLEEAELSIVVREGLGSRPGGSGSGWREAGERGNRGRRESLSMDSHVAQLVEMGFEARAATAALHDHPRFEDALNFLMTNPGWMPGVLHATSSTPAEAVVAYEV